MPTKKNLLSIKSIEIRKLFGYYSYNIPAESKDISKLLILYGDNGSGKTTILKLLFWLLSSKDKSGFKSKIALTKFKKIKITFLNGVEIGAERTGKNILGGFNYYLKQPSKATISVSLKPSPNGSITLTNGTKENDQFVTLLAAIEELKISVFFLSEDRKILNSITSSSSDNADDLENEFYLSARIIDRKKRQKKDLLLDPAFERLNDWIRTKTISGSRTGEKNSQVIFTDLIKNIFKSREAGKKIKTKDQIINEITTIDQLIIPYIDLGLTDKFDSKSLVDALKRSNTRKEVDYLITIITPYLEGINAKLKALEKLKDILNLFLFSVNDYFSNKTLFFNLTTGFNLIQHGKEIISFEHLSSGEKQLLLLFINTITATEEATIFIIDEPEISLNIKWQRKLIETLIKFSVDKNIQYVFATHSLEVLSQNMDQVSKLEDIDKSDLNSEGMPQTLLEESKIEYADGDS